MSKSNYSKKEIINILYASAKKYQKYLLNKNIIFIYKDKTDNKLNFIETYFQDFNFMHLTGIKYISDNLYIISGVLNFSSNFCFLILPIL